MMKRVVRKNSETNSYGFSIMLTQDYNNVGLYTPTDGQIGQLDMVCNFVVKTIRTKRYVTLKDGVDLERYKFIKGLTYTVNWGDIYWIYNEDDSDADDPYALGDEWIIGEGLPEIDKKYKDGDKYYDLNTDKAYHWHPETIEIFSVDGQSHVFTYPVSSEEIITNGDYEIKMTMSTPWGNHQQIKNVMIPPVDSRDITFDMTMTTPEEIGYDTEMLAYVNNTGVIICRNAVSRLNEVTRYGNNVSGATISDVEGMGGVNGISQSTGNVITYYIDRIKYMDDTQTGETTISLYPDNFTSGDVVDGVEYINEMLFVEDGPVVHQEVFNGVTGDIDIQSDIFINRGKQAPFEFYYKLGEISNMKELEQNGNKFFTINNVDDFKL
jgi:hypothetical protein